MNNRRTPVNLNSQRPAWVKVAVTAAIVVAVVIAAVFYLKARSDHENASNASPTVATSDGAVVFGSAEAPAVVDVYADYQCPICQQFELASGPVLRAAVDAGTAQVRFHPIAILDRMSSTQYSSRAAGAAVCVAEYDNERWLDFSEQLYTHQPPEGGSGLTDQALVSIATSVGAEDPQIADCVTGGAFVNWVGTATQEALSRGVTGTPTIFVNGVALADRSPTAVQAAIDGRQQ